MVGESLQGRGSNGGAGLMLGLGRGLMLGLGRVGCGLMLQNAGARGFFAPAEACSRQGRQLDEKLVADPDLVLGVVVLKGENVAVHAHDDRSIPLEIQTGLMQCI